MSRGTSERGTVLLHTRQACSARPVKKILAHALVQFRLIHARFLLSDEDG
jgi:hypothetical protein